MPGGVLDFLFEGRPPAAVNTYGQTVENIPKWLSDYTQGLIGRANVIAAEPYQEYGGPRIAGFTPDQMSAFDMTRQNVGSHQPYYDYATGMTEAGGNQNPLAAAQPYIEGGSQSFPGQVGQYMDPYIQNVLNRQQELSNRNLYENVIPGVQDMFVGSGSFGGDRMAEIGTRAARDVAEGLQGQQLGALSQAYGQAGELFGADQQRQLLAGQMTGNLAGQTGELQLAAGAQMGDIGSELRGLGAGDAASLEAVGAAQQQMGQGSLDLAYQDFLRQQNYPRENINWMSEIIRGMPHSTVTDRTEVGPASSYGPSPLSQIASLYSTYRGLSNPQQAGGQS